MNDLWAITKPTQRLHHFAFSVAFKTLSGFLARFSWKRGEKWLQHLSQHDSAHPISWEVLGDFHRIKQQEAKAIQYYQKAIETYLEPGNELRLDRLAPLMERCLQASLKCGSAIATQEMCQQLFEEAGNRHCRTPEHYLKLAHCLIRNPNIDPFQVATHYRQGIVEFPFDVHLPAALGQYYFHLKDIRTAIRYYEQALALAPFDLQLLAELAGMHLINGLDIDRFQEICQRAMLIRPFRPRTYYYRGLIHYFLNEPVVARQLFARSKNKVGPYYDLGWEDLRQIQEIGLQPFWEWEKD